MQSSSFLHHLADGVSASTDCLAIRTHVSCYFRLLLPWRDFEFSANVIIAELLEGHGRSHGTGSSNGSAGKLAAE
eukprot:COSAG02_NODE_69_length_42323_cov_23.507850_12_plen_75_part_00